MKNYLQKTTSATPLAVFRIAFGLLLFVSMVRFSLNGWIDDLYIKPLYYFSFYGFEFVKPLGEYTYVLFALCGICSLLVAMGLFYRIASIGLFLTFTYIELIDKSTYLNHYYFISMMSLLMIVLPANAYFSVDAYRNKKLLADRIPQWNIDSIKFLVCILYFLAGVAKVNSDWLLEAMPLKIWLPAKNDIPVIGFLFNYVWVAYAFSWIGCVYDLSIPFLLLNRKTRVLAYVLVAAFHLLTSMLFPIGMFPYIMMATALIFFSAEFHGRIISKLGSWLKVSQEFLKPSREFTYRPITQNILIFCLSLFFVVQVALPFRYLLYPGELFWTEEGYRFSWRVMLMEKAGYTQFTVKDSTGNRLVVDNTKFLTPLQEKMMSTQPDMILQYAHILRDYYSVNGFQAPQVYVDSYVALNGRLSKLFIDPSVNLAQVEDSYRHKTWVLKFNDEIKGF